MSITSTKNRICFLVVFSILAPFYAISDLFVNLEFEHTSFVQGESVNVLVTFENETDEEIVIDYENAGGTADFFFDIERVNGGIVRRVKEEPVIKTMKLKPDEQHSILIDISDFYDVLKEGRYLILGVLKTKEQFYKSSRKVIEIVKGIELIQQTRTISKNGINVARSYALRYWTREKKEWLFLVVEDENGTVNLGAFLLGPLIRFFKPELKVDREGNITTYHQSGPNRFTRTAFKATPYEVIFEDQNYFDESGNPLQKTTGELEEYKDTELPPEAKLPDKPKTPKKRRSLFFWNRE